MSRKKVLEDQEGLIKSIHNKFSGETVVVLGCSPFLSEYDSATIRNILNANRVIAIKQSYNLFKNFVDIHAYNCCNIQNYDYGEIKPMIFEASSLAPSSNPFDLYFHIKERDKRKSLSALCANSGTCDELDKWTFSRSGNLIKNAWDGCDIHLRPCGPGIMSELIFYICEHLGFSRIILIGCDNESSGSRTHFYRDKDNKCQEVSNDPHHSAPWINFNEEKNMHLRLMDSWNKWFSGKGVSLELVSRFNNYPKSIKKIKINEIV
jgi:hypothetical protein